MNINPYRVISSKAMIPAIKTGVAKHVQESRTAPVVNQIMSSNLFIKLLDKLSIPVHPYIKQVSSKFYRGSQIKPKDISKIAQKGINVVISLKAETAKNMKSLRDAYKKYGIEYINIPLNPFSNSEEGIEKVVEALKQKRDKSVYVHCSFGKDRTGLVTALYRTIFENWTLESALKEMKEFGYRENIFPQMKTMLQHLTQNFSAKNA